MNARFSVVCALVCSVLACGLVLTSAEASACSCPRPPPIAKEFARSDAVFLGLVLSIERNGQVGRRAQFAVYGRWKGSVGARVALRMSPPCDYAFMEGQSYLVYASGDGEPLSASLCSRTTASISAEDEIAVLDKLATRYRPPQPPASAQSPPAPAPTAAVADGPTTLSPAEPSPAPTPAPRGPVEGAPEASPPPATTSGCAGCAVPGAHGGPGAWALLGAVAGAMRYLERRRRP